jgi:hypothetical protein
VSLVYGKKPVRGEYLKLSKNILIAFAVSIIFSAIIAQVLSEEEDYLNTSYTLIADYIFYFSTFAILYYFDNRKKYRLESGETDKVKLKHDLLKLCTSLGIAEVVYNIVRWVLQYHLLSIDYDPYLASIYSQVVSMIIYLIIMNLSMKMTSFSRYKSHSAWKFVFGAERMKLFRKKPPEINPETLILPIEELPTEALNLTYNKLMEKYNRIMDVKTQKQLVMISKILRKRSNVKYRY